MNIVFSLKKAIDKLDREEQRYQATLECYLAAISGIQEHAVEVTPELTEAYGRSLQELRLRLRNSPDVEELTKSRATLVHALADYRAKAAACLSGKEDDFRAMLTSLAEVADTLSGNNNQQSEGLKTFTRHLQIVARGTDLSQMRRELTKRVAELKVMQEEMTHAGCGLVSSMRKQLVEFQERLDRTEKRAMTDSLTGLLNRGEGEMRLLAQLQSGQPVSIILIDLDNFKQINDLFGHLSGDQVLKTFGHILTHNIRPPDMACRWGGDEFLIVMNGDERSTGPRVLHLCEKFRPRCKLVVRGELHDVDVKASIGLAHAQAGETLSDLLTRADTDLYRHKKGGKDRNGEKPPPEDGRSTYAHFTAT